MCGITGVWTENQPITKEFMFSSVKSLLHRGPDAQSIWINNYKNIGLGHARLSINDINGGRQPIISEDGKIILVINGELYNYKKIRSDLIKQEYKFKTHSDSEIIIPLYQKHSTDCLRFLNGEFAFILIDLEKNILFAARDRFGVKPLFYTFYKNNFYIASECKSLFDMGVPCNWDKTGIISSEIYLYYQDYSIFNKIKSIKPGHYIIFKPTKLVTKCYWDINYNTSEVTTYNTEDSVSQFKQKLHKAVTLRLDTDASVACYLSGGIDSSAIVALASLQYNSYKKLDTFTIAFEDPVYDESNLAKQVANHLGVISNIVFINQKMLADNFAKTVWHCESPLFNCSSVAKYILSQTVKKYGYKVVLTGEGADEILAGYLPFREDILTSKKDFLTLKTLYDSNNMSKGIYFNNEERVSKNKSNFKNLEFIILNKLGYVPTQLKNSINKAILFSDFHLDRAQTNKQLNLFIKNFIFNIFPKHNNNIDQLNKSLYLWQKSIFPYVTLLQLGDRVEMANSIEARLPFLDLEVVEFTSKLPISMKINNMTEKYILREVCKDLVPVEVYNKSKHPFLAPSMISKNTPIGDLIHDYFNSDLLKENPFYDQKKVLKIFNRVIEGSENNKIIYESIFFHILSVLMIQEKFSIT